MVGGISALGGVGGISAPEQQELANLKITFFLRPKSAAAESWHASGARQPVAARCSGLSRRAAAAESAQTAGGAGAVLRPERAENRLPALPKRGPWRAERRMGRPHMPLARGHGREPALAAIACEKSDLVHVPPRLVHVRGGVGKFDFFLLPAFVSGSQWPFRTPQGVRYGVMWSGCGSEGVAS